MRNRTEINQKRLEIIAALAKVAPHDMPIEKLVDVTHVVVEAFLEACPPKSKKL